MAVTVRWPQTVTEGRFDTEVFVDDAETFEDALAQLTSDLDASMGGFSLSTLGSVDAVPGVPGLWIAKPIYKLVADKPNKGVLQSGEFEFSFSSVKQSIKRTVSIESKCFEASGETNPHDKQLINCDPKTGVPRGADVTEYLNAFRWRVAVPFSTAAESWRRSVGELRGTLNQSSFFGYEARSVMFDDITGGVKAKDLYNFDLSFTQKTHQTGVSIGGITVGNVDAWSVIDVETEPEEATISSKKQLLPKVKRVKIHRVDRIADWSLIASVLGMS